MLRQTTLAATRSEMRRKWLAGGYPQECSESCRGGLRRRPGDVLAVQLVVTQAAVEDASQAVGQDPQRLLVALLPVTSSVVVASGARRGGDRREGPPLARIGSPPKSVSRWMRSAPRRLSDPAMISRPLTTSGAYGLVIVRPTPRPNPTSAASLAAQCLQLGSLPTARRMVSRSGDMPPTMGGLAIPMNGL